jgi:hypothetical protein
MEAKMAKAQPKKKPSSLRWLLLGGGLLVVYILATQGDEAKPAAKAKAVVKKKSPNDQDYVAADYDAAKNPYAALKGPVVDAFKPAIFRPTGGGMDKGWPTAFGGPGWTYSGMAVVDGVSQGLLENASTGDSVLLHKGQRWQNGKAGDIYADHMVLIGPDGPRTVSVEEAKDTSPSAPTATGNLPLPAMSPMAPVQVPMGNIGSANDSLSIVQDNPGAAGPGRRGRRGRRNAG